MRSCASYQGSHWDSIVIGSGLGGLTAAATLARAGQKVLVVEQHFAPGGNAQSFLRRKHFSFDVGVHTLDDCGPGGAIPSILNNLGVQVEFAPLDDDGFDVLHFPDRVLRVPCSWEAYRERLVQAFPQERMQIESYVDYLLSVLARIGMGRGFTKLLLLKRPSRLLEPLLRADERYLDRARRMETNTNAVELERRMGKDLTRCTLDDLFTALGVSQPLRHALGGQNLLYGTCWTSASAALHALVLDRYLQGSYYPRGGARALVEALEQVVTAAGGTVLLRHRVQRILVEEHRACGIELDDGTVLRAGAVISNADARRTALELVDTGQAPPPWRDRAGGATMATPLFVVYMALAVPPAELALPNANTWLFPAYNLEQQYAACTAGELPEQPLVYISVASLKDPTDATLAPPGHTNLQLMALAPAAPTAWGATAGADERTYRHHPDYVARKRQYEQRMLEVVHTMLPGLLRDVVWQESATPLTHARFTHGSGTGYGLDHTPDQLLTGRMPIITPIPGLYQVGASTVFGHGVTGALLSARACAQAVLGATDTRTVD